MRIFDIAFAVWMVVLFVAMLFLVFSGPEEPVVEEVEIEVPVPVVFMIPVPGSPIQLSENEELGAWSDPAGRFYCFPATD